MFANSFLQLRSVEREGNGERSGEQSGESPLEI